MRRATASGLAASVLASAALAAGGAHVVEDSEVLEPGLCQVDLWGHPVRSWRRLCQCDTDLHAGKPAAPGMGHAVPVLLVQRAPGARPASGANLKVNLVPEDKGVGVGLYFNSGVNLSTGDLEVATLLVPVTITLGERFRLNLNAVEAKVGGETTLMLETFGRARGAAAAQLGIRWRPSDGPVDFDFLVGSSFDKVLAGEFLDRMNSLFFTVGVTLRW